MILAINTTTYTPIAIASGDSKGVANRSNIPVNIRNIGDSATGFTMQPGEKLSLTGNGWEAKAEYAPEDGSPELWIES